MREYKRKTTRGEIPPDLMLQAAREVKLQHKSIRSVAREYDIPDRTLTRFCAKISQQEIAGQNPVPKTNTGYAKHRQVRLQEIHVA